ncbi:hypothetical protein ASPWEDRAFT_30422 [Aspergillus wentii DTO 134E9]|uniref:Uncharacterized protein n=1 Tax=Aspergillus wentii DTO 134E9 TaxID=1073089 RepID=A0A1L9REN5_ASPWE|nr:uncharacterized protein ASPWEDRAFT_30422 [Aspergillus wentii DTO 134E9]KAI9933585.1 hypothetical protein MW887_008058 [Aspergillus wentii]OJJ33337.1 hypothetical protein ASPWEDRAFT_30422 [Aspergillus wentii DTO 134E9]
MTEIYAPIPPFSKDDQLEHSLWISEKSNTAASICGENIRNKVSVPGHPLLSATDTEEVQKFLSDQLLTPRLNELYPIFWMVATRKSDHIYALHHQIVRGRDIIPSEDPGLHLIWYYDIIYVKPMPRYLLNYAFWRVHLSGCDEESAELRKSALGFMRTYSYLIQSEYDFDIARAKCLISKNIEGMNGFVDFLHFIDHFRHIQDSEVSRRYDHYGQLRLSRLNLWSKLYQWRMFYYKVDGQYGAYFARFTPPFLFIFGTVSVALSAMAVILAVDQDYEREPNWAFAQVSTWFSVVCLAIIAATIAFFPAMQVIFILEELVYVICHHFRS